MRKKLHANTFKTGTINRNLIDKIAYRPKMQRMILDNSIDEN